MSDLDLRDAAMALRDEARGPSNGADATRMRILGTVRARRRRNVLVVRTAAVLLAAAFGGVAWAAATGRLPPLTALFADASITDGIPTNTAPPREPVSAGAPRPKQPVLADTAPALTAPETSLAPDPAATPALPDSRMDGSPAYGAAAAPAGSAQAASNTFPAAPPDGVVPTSTASLATGSSPVMPARTASPPPPRVATNGVSPTPTATTASPATGSSSVPGATASPTSPRVATLGVLSAPTATPASPAASSSATGAPATSAAASSAATDSAEAAADALYQRAHALHFQAGNWASARAAWDAYLKAAPGGRFATFAHYNRALCLLRLGQTAEARRVLSLFASGAFGGYRKAEAQSLLDALGAAKGEAR